MAEILLFHHAHGLTSGVRAFADKIRLAGHTVHVPDLYEGRIFDDLEAGVGYAQKIGFGTIIERGLRAASTLPKRIVYAGFSLGVLPAQKLAQTRTGAQGTLLFHSCVRVAEFSSAWPHGTPVQIHAMDADKWFVEEGDLLAAHELVASGAKAQLFLYRGDRHLFADSSLSSYDEGAAGLLMERVIGFLDAIG
jgi:dienelactone hydrolase